MSPLKRHSPSANALTARALVAFAVANIAFVWMDLVLMPLVGVEVLATRVVWSVALLGSAWVVHRDSPHRTPVLAVTAVITAISLGIVVRASGGVQGPLFGWFTAIPFLLALVLPSDTGIVVLTGLCLTVVGGSIALASGLSTPVACAWAVTIALAGALAAFGSVRWRALHDARERARAERTRLRASIADAELRSEEEAALAHLRRLALVGGLTTSVAQELAEPASVVADCADRLAEAGEPAVVDALHRAARRLMLLRRDLQGATRPSTGAANVADRVAEAIRLTRPRWRRNSRLEVDLGNDLPTVALDGVRLVHTLVNLIVYLCDAMDHTRDDHVVALKVYAVGSDVQIAIRAPTVSVHHDPSTIFGAFYTAPGDDPSALGLALCRSWLTEVGGSVRAVPLTNGGLMLDIQLPALVARNVPPRLSVQADPASGTDAGRREEHRPPHLR